MCNKQINISIKSLNAYFIAGIFEWLLENSKSIFSKATDSNKYNCLSLALGEVDGVSLGYLDIVK